MWGLCLTSEFEFVNTFLYVSILLGTFEDLKVHALYLLLFHGLCMKQKRSKTTKTMCIPFSCNILNSNIFQDRYRKPSSFLNDLWSHFSSALMPWGWFWSNPPTQRDVLTQQVRSSMMGTMSIVPQEVHPQKLLRACGIDTRVPLWKHLLPRRRWVSAVFHLCPMKDLMESAHREIQPRCRHWKPKT